MKSIKICKILAIVSIVFLGVVGLLALPFIAKAISNSSTNADNSLFSNTTTLSQTTIFSPPDCVWNVTLTCASPYIANYPCIGQGIMVNCTTRCTYGIDYKCKCDQAGYYFGASGMPPTDLTYYHICETF